jgi:2-keto-4-pentenoate hydratase/2-oxohepta-3-ene-1,7-dioic acid hydratase in catechol pathway
MKLLRYGPPGQEKPGLLDRAGRIRDLSAVVSDIRPGDLGPQGLARLAGVDSASLPLVEGDPRIGVPVAGVGKMICVGLNYRDHAKESNMPEPAEPIIFMKATTALCGPNDQIMLPRGSEKTDWEVELGIVIGTKARYVPDNQAMDYVAGYTIVNDVSERHFQLERGGQWVKGKSADTFGPTGPWLVTRDEVPDPQKLGLWLEVNGQRHQDGNTANMIFRVDMLVSYISHFMTLMPGDIISTGTPAGVGAGFKPPIFLKAGDVVRLGIEGLGEQRQEVVAFGE